MAGAIVIADTDVHHHNVAVDATVVVVKHCSVSAFSQLLQKNAPFEGVCPYTTCFGSQTKINLTLVSGGQPS